MALIGRSANGKTLHELKRQAVAVVGGLFATFFVAY